MSKKQISIIIPAYNAEKCLKRCLDALLQQTYPNFEILLIDDGSTDGTASICQEYEKKDSRIRVFHQKNAGVSKARNQGIAEAVGEYVMFVDSDDYVEKKHVELHYQAIETHRADFVISGYYICKGENLEANKILEEYEGVWKKQEFCQHFLKLYEKFFINSPWNKIYKRKLLTMRFPEDMALGEDLYLNIQYLKTVEKVVILSECSYFYVCQEAGQSLTGRITKENFYSFLKNFHFVLDFCKQWKIEDTRIVKEMYVEGMISMVFSMARKNFSKQQQKEILLLLQEDKVTRKAMKEIVTKSWKSELVRVLLSKGRREILGIFLRIYGKLRKEKKT